MPEPGQLGAGTEQRRDASIVPLSEVAHASRGVRALPNHPELLKALKATDRQARCGGEGMTNSSSRVNSIHSPANIVRSEGNNRHDSRGLAGRLYLSGREPDCRGAHRDRLELVGSQGSVVGTPTKCCFEVDRTR